MKCVCSVGGEGFCLSTRKTAIFFDKLPANIRLLPDEVLKNERVSLDLHESVCRFNRIQTQIVDSLFFLASTVFVPIVVDSPIVLQSLITVHERDGSENNSAYTAIAINTIFGLLRDLCRY
jgi:hypothetical protein